MLCRALAGRLKQHHCNPNPKPAELRQRRKVGAPWILPGHHTYKRNIRWIGETKAKLIFKGCHTADILQTVKNSVFSSRSVRLGKLVLHCLFFFFLSNSDYFFVASSGQGSQYSRDYITATLNPEEMDFWNVITSC